MREGRNPFPHRSTSFRCSHPTWSPQFPAEPEIRKQLKYWIPKPYRSYLNIRVLEHSAYGSRVNCRSAILLTQPSKSTITSLAV